MKQTKHVLARVRQWIAWTQNDQICLPSLVFDCPWKPLGTFVKRSSSRARAEQIGVCVDTLIEKCWDLATCQDQLYTQSLNIEWAIHPEKVVVWHHLLFLPFNKDNFEYIQKYKNDTLSNHSGVVFLLAVRDNKHDIWSHNPTFEYVLSQSRTYLSWIFTDED